MLTRFQKYQTPQLFFVDTENVEVFSNKIIELYTDGYSQELIENAKARASRFCWNKAAAALLRNTDFIVD